MLKKMVRNENDYCCLPLGASTTVRNSALRLCFRLTFPASRTAKLYPELYLLTAYSVSKTYLVTEAFWTCNIPTEKKGYGT